MEKHTRALLQRFQHSEQFKETAAFRIVFGGEPPSQVMADLDMHNSYTLRNWVWGGSSENRQGAKIGLFSGPVQIGGASGSRERSGGVRG